MDLPLEPGARDRQVTIQQRTASVATSGFPVETWRTLACVWMSRETPKGMERQVAGQITARTDWRWVMPYRADMDPDLVDVPGTRRLLWQNRPYDIVSAAHLGRKEGIELMTIASTVVP